MQILMVAFLKTQVTVRVYNRERNLHYAQIWSKKSANARNMKIGMGTLIYNQTS